MLLKLIQNTEKHKEMSIHKYAVRCLFDLGPFTDLFQDKRADFHSM